MQTKKLTSTPPRVRISPTLSRFRSTQTDMPKEAPYRKFSEQPARSPATKFASVDTEMRIALLRG